MNRSSAQRIQALLACFTSVIRCVHDLLTQADALEPAILTILHAMEPVKSTFRTSAPAYYNSFLPTADACILALCPAISVSSILFFFLGGRDDVTDSFISHMCVHNSLPELRTKQIQIPDVSTNPLPFLFLCV
jgi:hypothetical protein